MNTVQGEVIIHINRNNCNVRHAGTKKVKTQLNWNHTKRKQKWTGCPWLWHQELWDTGINIL